MAHKNKFFEPTSRIFDLRSFGITSEEPLYCVVIPPPVVEEAGLGIGDWLVWRRIGREKLFFKIERGRVK